MALIPFDDRDGVLWFDGHLIPWRDARLHVLTHGLHYGSCVFEGERAYGGHIFKLEEHTKRLHASAAIMGFEIPHSVERINAACRQLLKEMDLADAYVRPVAWRGSEMMGVSAQKNSIHTAIAVWEWPSYFAPEARMQGIRLDWALYRRPDPRTAPVLCKAAGLYMICTLSKHAAETNGYQDALMLDWRGRVAETTGANIFLVQNGVLHTPIPDCFLDGITRRTVIGLAKSRGYEVVEREILPEEFGVTQEVFITGTAAEVTPISEIGEYSFQVGEITKALMEDYDSLVRMSPATAAAAE